MPRTQGGSSTFQFILDHISALTQAHAQDAHQWHHSTPKPAIAHVGVSLSLCPVYVCLCACVYLVQNSVTQTGLDELDLFSAVPCDSSVAAEQSNAAIPLDSTSTHSRRKPVAAHLQPSHSPSGRSIPRGTIGSFTNRSDCLKTVSRVPAMRDKATPCSIYPTLVQHITEHDSPNLRLCFAICCRMYYNAVCHLLTCQSAGSMTVWPA